jgi:ABC-type molybdate transport system ATPase subunit
MGQIGGEFECEQGVIEAQVRLGQEEVPARISRQAMEELGIAAGRRVFVLVKAIAFDKRSVREGFLEWRDAPPAP